MVLRERLEIPTLSVDRKETQGFEGNENDLIGQDKISTEIDNKWNNLYRELIFLEQSK